MAATYPTGSCVRIKKTFHYFHPKTFVETIQGVGDGFLYPSAQSGYKMKIV